MGPFAYLSLRLSSLGLLRGSIYSFFPRICLQKVKKVKKVKFLLDIPLFCVYANLRII